MTRLSMRWEIPVKSGLIVFFALAILARYNVAEPRGEGPGEQGGSAETGSLTQEQIPPGDEAAALAERLNEASAFKAQGQLDAAREIEEQVLEARRRILGSEHPDTLISMSNLAETFLRQGDLTAAREFQERALETQQRVLGVEHPSTLWSMSNVGAILQTQGDLVAARELQERALEAQRRMLGPEHPDTLISMANLAVTLFAQGDLAAARELQERALETQRRILGPEHPDTLTVMNSLAETYLEQGDLAAHELQERTLEMQLRVLGPEHPSTLRSMGSLAVILYHTQKDLVAARELVAEALEAQLLILGPEHLDTLESMGILASTLQAQGELAAARELKEEVLEARHRILGPEHPDTVISMGNLANTLKAQGELAAAHELEERVLEARRRILGPEHPHTLIAMGHLANSLHRLGDLAAAHELTERVLEARRRILGPEHPHTLISMGYLANSLYSLGDVASAHELEEKVLEARRRILGPEHPHTLGAMAVLASRLSAQGDLVTARELSEKVLEVSRRILGPEHPTTLSAMCRLAWFLSEQGDSQRAEALLKRVLPIYQELPDTSAEAVVLGRLGKICQSSQRLGEAADHYRRAIIALENRIGKLGESDDLRAAFRARNGPHYRSAIEVAVARGRPEEAFGILERSRARTFLEMLRQRDLIFSDIPEHLDAARRRLAVVYDRTLRQLAEVSEKEDPEEYTALLSELRQLRRDHEKNTTAIRRASPRFATLESPEPLDLPAVRQTLDPGTVMLSYNVGAASTYLFVVTREGPLEVHTLLISEAQLRNEIDRFRRLIEVRTRPGPLLSPVIAAGKRLFTTLLGPAIDRLKGSERVLIIPDGPLHRLPFGALIRETNPAGRGWQYLVEWKPLHSVLSATVYAELRKSRQPTASDTPITIAAFGDPEYPQSMTEEDAGQIHDLRLRSVVKRGIFDWKPLPHSRSEVEGIAELYPSARIYLGADATEERAKAVGKELRIVHFATHGYLDDRMPLNSFLALTVPEDASNDRDNGLLQAWEIFERVRLDADLVVLSACKSGLGQEQGGEGLIGLSRAFQYAGARSVAATLWSVADDTTAELMIRFYRHLRDGKPKDEALRAAQLELLRGPVEVKKNGRLVEKDASAPFYWAAFQIIGDWQ